MQGKSSNILLYEEQFLIYLCFWAFEGFYYGVHFRTWQNNQFPTIVVCYNIFAVQLDDSLQVPT